MYRHNKKMHYRTNPITRRLRMIMVAAIGLDLVVTLVSQPPTWRLHPETAFESNQLFHYFLTLGLAAYVFLFLLYILAAFLLVSRLPLYLAVATIFSFLFLHYFRVACWLDYHWGFGMSVVILSAFILGYIIMYAAFPGITLQTMQVVRRLRWMMLGVMVFDTISTLHGQPDSYWQHPMTANEGFLLARYFITQGLAVYLLYDLVIFTFYYFLVSWLPPKVAAVVAFALILAYFFGASTWINNGWNFSAQGPVIFGMILAFIFADLVLRKNYPVWSS
jgi:hypothetical protein